MIINFIKTPRRRKIIEKLNEQFGIEELPYLLIESGKEKIRAFSGHLSKEEIAKISDITHVEIVGMYLLKEENSEYRLSLDASLALSNQIKKNIIEISEEQYELWIRGNDLDIQNKRGVYIIKFKGDFIGCGKSNEQKIFNYVPKDRRLKNAYKPKPITPQAF
jgi:NOL1/NOP2/fmu family ribosome biogenesis protein